MRQRQRVITRQTIFYREQLILPLSTEAHRVNCVFASSRFKTWSGADRVSSVGRTCTLTRGFLKRRKYSCGAYRSSVAMMNRRASRKGFSSRVNGRGFLQRRVIVFSLPCAPPPRSGGQCRPKRESLRNDLAGSPCRYGDLCAL